MNQTTFRYLDHTNKSTFHDQPYTALTSFALDDALTLSISDRLSPPTLRAWVHEQTIVLGIPDARLPYIEDGIKLLRRSGYDVVIRNSGGLAVALDNGVLNLSLILPNIKNLSIHDGYEAMLGFVQYLLRDLTEAIQAYEIIGSYCPGDYDLSIDGIKFAGISQRRIKDGAAIQIYIDVDGKSQERAHLIQEFYQRSLRKEPTTFSYPTVQPEKMGSLSTLLGIPLTVENVKTRVYQALTSVCEQITHFPPSEKELITYEKRLGQMKKRNERISHFR